MRWHEATYRLTWRHRWTQRGDIVYEAVYEPEWRWELPMWWAPIYLPPTPEAEGR